MEPQRKSVRRPTRAGNGHTGTGPSFQHRVFTHINTVKEVLAFFRICLCGPFCAAWARKGAVDMRRAGPCAGLFAAPVSTGRREGRETRRHGLWKNGSRSETSEGASAYDGAAAARVTGTHTPRSNAASGRGGRVGSPQWRKVAIILAFSCLYSFPLLASAAGCRRAGDSGCAASASDTDDHASDDHGDDHGDAHFTTPKESRIIVRERREKKKRERKRRKKEKKTYRRTALPLTCRSPPYQRPPDTTWFLVLCPKRAMK